MIHSWITQYRYLKERTQRVIVDGKSLELEHVALYIPNFGFISVMVCDEYDIT